MVAQSPQSDYSTTFEEKVLSALGVLQNDVSGLKQGQEELRTDVRGLKQGQKELRRDVQDLQVGQESLQKDVRRLQTGQEELRKDVQDLQVGQKELRRDVNRLEVLHEETKEKIDQIIESVSPEMQKNTEQDLRLDDHDQKLALHDAALRFVHGKAA